MRIVRPLVALLLALSSAGTWAQDQIIVVQANVARTEIERILDLDNLDVELLLPRDVAVAMTNIEKGRAPRDFWVVYQAHVNAWQRYANATGPARLMLSNAVPDEEVAAKRAEAKLAIESTFDEVERIARRYGARVPLPRTRTTGY